MGVRVQSSCDCIIPSVREILYQRHLKQRCLMLSKVRFENTLNQVDKTISQNFELETFPGVSIKSTAPMEKKLYLSSKVFRFIAPGPSIFTLAPSKHFEQSLFNILRHILKKMKAKSSSQIGPFFYPMFTNWARAKRANIGCSPVSMSDFSSPILARVKVFCRHCQAGQNSHKKPKKPKKKTKIP